jgi:hypothetical protein
MLQFGGSRRSPTFTTTAHFTKIPLSVRRIERFCVRVLLIRHLLTPLRLFSFRLAGYDPNNEHFRKSAEFFWNRYSIEEDSWRDQPLWCHTLERFHVKPIIIGNRLFQANKRRMGHNGHTYGAAQDNDGAASKSSATSTP